MPRLVPIPAALVGRAFSVAEARNAGLTPGRLRSSDLARPFHGVRVAAMSTNTSPNALEQQLPRFVEESSVEPELLERCGAYAHRMRDGEFFSHVTAARLWGAPLPRGFAPDELLHVSRFRPHNAARSRGVVGHQLAEGSTALTMRFGLPVADAASAWMHLAGVLPVVELVAVGDHLVLDPHVLNPRDPRPYTSIEQLTAQIAGFSGRGKRAAVQARARVRVGAESRPETLLRLMLVDAGLPEPLLNQSLRNAAGRFIGRVDMIYPEWRVIVEYDGDQHRISTAQYERDSTRIDELRRAGFTVLRVRMHGLFVRPDATAARVRAALLEAGWRG